MPSTTVRIPTQDGQADAFAAYPDDGERHPGVLLYADAFGLRPELRDKARQLADHGYYVLVPNIFYRHGQAPVFELPPYIGEAERAGLFDQIMPVVQAHTAERVTRDADAYIRFLAAQPEVGAGPLGTIGYCMGASLALRTAAAHPDRVAAVAGFHPGLLVTDDADSPHRLLGKLTAEARFGLAEGDLTPEALAELTRALDATGVDHAIETYPGTVHGFTMSDTSAFHPAGLQLHWDRLLPLLRRTLRAG
ncbi:dienelactone hydrolase family protein [Streptomyces sp. 71268]|uniref:dienelactone hydrolase family protein n=1 Tax=Streptomyces sp. 71268 TaxID=3002640 RepID=UPI0023F804DE|nr:dienelactone hydrolase family protein [Streptomyces sp. 71268]WEV25707.1 dienelactone hydrolase family protein [Streptomyces sp. 71268]